MSNEGTSGNTSRTGTTSFESQPEGGSFSPIRPRPGGVANAVGGAFREFSGSGSADRMARPNRLSPRLTPDPAVPFGRITGVDEKHSRQQQTRIRRTE